MAGLAAETVIRLLGDLKTEGLIDVAGRTIRILSRDRLERIARS
jgi:CRP/FNR family transcriptional regulator, polysaccharide utilization system transcription regulator